LTRSANPRIDFRPGEERQQDRAEARKEVHPFGDLQADEVAGEGADDDFDQRDRDGHTNGDQRREQRQADP
jgi:hypothetical protein